MKPLASPQACFEREHEHVVIERRLKLARGLLTLWLCPVRRSLSVLWEDDRDDAATLSPHGQL